MSSNPQPITTIPDADIAETLARYDVGSMVRCEPALHGIENTNYFVEVERDGESREYVLTLIESRSAQTALLVALLDVCDDAGLPVAPIVRNAAGHPEDELDGKPVLLAPRLEGRHVANPTFKHCEALGRFLARFHIACGGLTSFAEDHPRDVDWLRQHAELASGYVPYGHYRLISSAVDQVTSLLKRADVAALPRGVIHGDLFRDNVLFNERGLTGVLDFHHAAIGAFIFDLAVAANDWCNDSHGVLDPDRVMALVGAYHKIRPLTLEEIWFFPVYSLYAATAFWLSRLSVALARGSGTLRFNNPEEFHQIVEQHIAHFFYIDPRLLD